MNTFTFNTHIHIEGLTHAYADAHIPNTVTLTQVHIQITTLHMHTEAFIYIETHLYILMNMHRAKARHVPYVGHTRVSEGKVI